MIIITEKSEIITPFNKIGDDNWIENTSKIIEGMNQHWDKKPALPITDDEISQLEEKLTISLPDDLKAFYKEFGLASIGESLLEIDRVDWLENAWEYMSEILPKFNESEKSILPHLVAFSDCLGDGNMMCFHSETQKLFYFDHQSQPYISRSFDNMNDYLKACLIFAQSEFCEGFDQQDILEEWCLEILHSEFPKDMIKKWLF